MLLSRWRKVCRCASRTPTQGEALVGGSSSAKLLSAMRSGTHWAGTFRRAAARKMTSTSCAGSQSALLEICCAAGHPGLTPE